MLLAITSGARFVEIPVNYLPRVGHSSVTGDLRKAFKLGLVMIGVDPAIPPRHDRALAQAGVPPGVRRRDAVGAGERVWCGWLAAEYR